ncbi:MAG TPA: hypothetical protein EYH07_07770 [Kiloniellaceae bacterium]|nr:hypothetical protein [Kiloniellaceae bacterium]
MTAAASSTGPPPCGGKASALTVSTGAAATLGGAMAGAAGAPPERPWASRRRWRARSRISSASVGGRSEDWALSKVRRSAL